jgi:hypothetical protein
VSTESISTADKLLLAFDACTFSQACGIPPPRFGKLIHGREYATTTVPLAALYTKVQSILTAISAQHTNPTQPPLVLNKHCIECHYATRCREIATKADDLSLLAKMSEKNRKKYHEKGIFTVTQLSYTFRPRRRPVERRKHEHALQALGIRKNQIHVVGAVTSPLKPRDRMARIGKEVAGFVHSVIFLGRGADHGVRGALAGGMPPERVHGFVNWQQAAEFMKPQLAPGDLVLLRAGRISDHMGRLYFALRGSVACQKTTCEKRILCDLCPELGAQPLIQLTIARAN